MNKHRAQQNLNLPLTYLYRTITHLCLCLPPSLLPSVLPFFLQDLCSRNIPLWGRGTSMKKTSGIYRGTLRGIPPSSWDNPENWYWKNGRIGRGGGSRAGRGGPRCGRVCVCCVYLGVMWWVFACGCGVCVPPCVRLRDTASACVLFVAGLPGPRVTETRQLWAKMPWLWSEFPQGQSSLAEQTAARSPEMGAMISSHPGRPNIPAGLERPCQPVCLRLRPEALPDEPPGQLLDQLFDLGYGLDGRQRWPSQVSGFHGDRPCECSGSTVLGTGSIFKSNSLLL